MKKFLLSVTAIIVFTSGAAAQNCNYYFLQNNKTIEFTSFNRKGNPDGKMVYLVSGVKNSGSTVSSDLNVEHFNKKGKSIVKGTGKIECKGGAMFVDMKMMMPAAQQEQIAKANAKGENMYLEYESNMKVGDALKDATMNMDFEQGGAKHSVAMVINNRKVEAKEPVTTTAGTWDCYKISSHTKITIKMLGVGIPVNFDSTEWYAPGFGLVKTESKYGVTAVTSIK